MAANSSLFVQALLQGGAPWGFTLKGGLEHGEPLIISKVEEGGKAGTLECPLLLGDEVVIINGVELTGFRQEAITLVKGSYKTLQLTVRRERCADLCCTESSPRHQANADQCSGGPQIRIKHRSSEPGSRPHSWHSTKLGESPLDSDSMMQISQGAIAAPWHQSYHASASTTDLSGYDAGFLRKSPDQYSSRGSMESLDHSHPAYSSCNLLSVSKSSNSIDHLHSKRDSAYSSFSTSSSIPEYLAAGPSFSKERSYSMDSVPQHRNADGIHQADIRYVRTVYDSQQGMSSEHEVLSAAILKANKSIAQSKCGSIQGRVCLRSNSSSGSSSTSRSSGCGTVTCHRHSAGPGWGQTHNDNSYENLKGAPSPPLRSDSYAATRNHERPSSWSSLEQVRSLRALHKGSCHHSSGSVASGKSSFGIEGQLHTVIEKSPESSPTIKPKQSLPSLSQPGSAMLQTGIYPVPLPEPHFAQIPTTNSSSGNVYPALVKESKSIPQKVHCEGVDSDVKMAEENGYQSITSYSSSVHSPKQPKQPNHVKDGSPAKCLYNRSNFQTQESKNLVMSIGQERKDPYTPVQPWREIPRPLHEMNIMESYRQPREEELSRCQEHNLYLPPSHSSCEVLQEHAQLQAGNQKIYTSVRFHNDSSTCQQRDQDRDHPLTRLENALAEVQRCASPQSTTTHCSTQNERSMSVMEKVSHFERQQTKPHSHSHSLSNYSSSICPNQATHSAKMPLSGLKDLQKGYAPPGRSWGTSHEGNTDSSQDLQPRNINTAQAQNRKPHDLHRSKSSFQLNEDNGKDLHRSKSTFHLEENSKDIQWKEDHQDIVGIVPDTTFTRVYRDSIKDAQSKVLRSTSFRRRDLSINPPPVPVKHMSLDRKGPNMSPKPTASPHTPKERHVIPVELPDKNNVPDLPKFPPVGPPVVRICGRKRLTMEQKKMSYSEPENIHEVGASDQETGLLQKKAPPQFQFSETSVADRRRMFELVATRNAGTKLVTSRPELKQMQQDALADYVERKIGRRIDGRPYRPHSAYMQSTSCLSMDSQSRTSTTSMCSLQEPRQEAFSEVNHQSFTFTVNTQYHPNRNTQTWSQSEMHQSAFRPQSAEAQKLERQVRRTISGHVASPNLNHLSSAPARRSSDEVFERAVPVRSSGKSASAENLLDRNQDRPVSQHFRSKSSPAVENHNLDVSARDFGLFGNVSKESRTSGSVASGQRSSSEVGLEKSSQLNSGLTLLNTPVIRRERQRHSDRPRSHSASGLAASVGLPCPFSSSEWHSTNKTQCQPNLDSITFPGTVPENLTSPLSGIYNPNSANVNSSIDALNNSEKTAHDHLHSDQKVTESVTSFSPAHSPCYSGLPTSPKASNSPTRSLPSLQISESSIGFATFPTVSQVEDEVFLSPTPPPLKPLSSREDNLSEEPSVLCPSAQLQTKEESLAVIEPQESQKLNSISEHLSVTTAHQEREGQLCDTVPSLSITSEPNITNFTTVISEPEPEELLESSESPLLARRERTEAEVRVETLARELVSKDEALAPFLDIWASTTTLDLMKDIFPSCSSAPWQHGKTSSSHGGGSVVSVAPEAHVKAVQGQEENDLDEEESSLKEKKVELLQALALSLEALQMDRERLAEQQQCYSALGCRIEALVQELCKPNEREKYRMFIGDLEKIVNLLLSLSGRLARVENALNALQREPEKGSTEEKASLQQKQRQLRSQQEDARELKENLDRRERIVLQFLGGYLSSAQLHDYRRYIRAKPALLIRQRHLDELIRHGEEQLCRLTENAKHELDPQTGSTVSSCSNLSQPTTVTSI